MRLLKLAIRLSATAAHKVLQAGWFVRRPKTFGAHAVALTPAGRLILVKLWYAPGWRLPGGGRAEGEDAAEAALRELREEIGMVAHGAVTLAGKLEEMVHFKRDTAALVIVRDVEYRPSRWNWEVEEVREVPPDRLPVDVAPVTARSLQAVRPLL